MIARFSEDYTVIDKVKLSRVAQNQFKKDKRVVVGPAYWDANGLVRFVMQMQRSRIKYVLTFRWSRLYAIRGTSLMGAASVMRKYRVIKGGRKCMEE